MAYAVVWVWCMMVHVWCMYGAVWCMSGCMHGACMVHVWCMMWMTRFGRCGLCMVVGAGRRTGAPVQAVPATATAAEQEVQARQQQEQEDESRSPSEGGKGSGIKTRRVVITGMGVVSSLGLDPDSFYR